MEPAAVIAEDDPFVTGVMGAAQSVYTKAVDPALEQCKAHHIGKAVAKAFLIPQRLIDFIGGIEEQRRSQLFVIGTLYVIDHLVGHGEIDLENDVEGVIIRIRLMIGDPEHLLVDKSPHFLLLLFRIGVGKEHGIAVNDRAAEEIVIGRLAQQIEQIFGRDRFGTDHSAVAPVKHRRGQDVKGDRISQRQPCAVIRLQNTGIDLRRRFKRFLPGIFGCILCVLPCGCALRTNAEQQAYRDQERGQFQFHPADPFCRNHLIRNHLI